MVFDLQLIFNCFIYYKAYIFVYFKCYELNTKYDNLLLRTKLSSYQIIRYNKV